MPIFAPKETRFLQISLREGRKVDKVPQVRGNMSQNRQSIVFLESAPHLNDALPIKHDRIGYSKEG